MNKEYYEAMVESIINDTEHYEDLTSDPHNETKQNCNKYLNKCQNTLTYKLDYLENL